MKRAFLLSAIVLTLIASSSSAEMAGYYVGRDARPLLGSDPNPNYGRLTFLYNHGNHFHSIGRFGGGPNLLPESYIGGAFTLFPGTGSEEGRFVSRRYDDGSPQAEYSNLTIESIRNLGGFDPGTEESILFNSSGGRWVSGPENTDHPLPLTGSLLALEVVQLSRGLTATNGDGSEVASGVGDRLTLGAGDSFSFLLRFVTELGVKHNRGLSAVFRLVDLNTGSPLEGSGDFRFNMTTIPEPTTGVLVGLGLAGLIVVRLRRRGRRVAILG